MNGVFDFREDLLGVVPYKIGDEEFEKIFILFDAIYPSHSRFVKAIKQHLMAGGSVYSLAGGIEERCRESIWNIEESM